MKCVRECSEPKEEENSPSRPREEPDDPGGETAVPGSVHDVQEHPRNVRNECTDETDAPGRVTGPGGYLELQEESEDIEGDSDRANIVDHAGYDRVCHRSDGNARVDETNAPCRDNRPGGHIGERGGPGDVECDRECQSAGDGVERDGRRCRTDGTPSGPRRNSTQVEMEPLAADETGQHGQRKRRITDVPESSKPPPIDHRLPTDHPDPPCRRGRLKTRPTRVSNPRWTYQATRTR